MKVFSLYQGFFDFLQEIGPETTRPPEIWPFFSARYYQPNKEFLDAYFSQMPLIDLRALKDRVNAIKPADYSLLKTLCAFSPPEKMIDEAYERCRRVVSPPQELEVYLLIGFFSPEGFVMEFKGKPVIGFGLERFRDFRLFQVIFAHEYAHFLLRLMKVKVPESNEIQYVLISEGLATIFSSLVLPGLPSHDYFFFSKERSDWCQANEARLKEIYCSGRFSPQELMNFYLRGNPEMGLPPRVAKYIGYQAVKRYLARNLGATLETLLLDQSLIQSIEI